MKTRLITLSMLVPVLICHASPSINEMRREMDQEMDRIIDQHRQTWDRIERNLESQEQKQVNRITIENQNGKLFGR